MSPAVRYDTALVRVAHQGSARTLSVPAQSPLSALGESEDRPESESLNGPNGELRPSQHRELHTRSAPKRYRESTGAARIIVRGCEGLRSR